MMTPQITRRALLAGTAVTLAGCGESAADKQAVSTELVFGIPVVRFGSSSKNNSAFLTLDGVLPPADKPIFPLGYALLRPAETETMWFKDNISSYRREAEIRLFNSSGAQISTHPLLLRPLCDAPDETQETTAFAAHALVPLADGMARLELISGGKVLFQRTFTTQPPALGDVQLAGSSLSWKVGHPENAPVAHMVTASLPDRGWMPVGYTGPLPAGPTKLDLSFPEPVTGQIRVALTATDGLRTTTTMRST